jgi:hypothetical protein
MTLERILSAAKNSMLGPNAKRQPHCYRAHVPGKGYVNDGALVADCAEFERQLERDVQSEIDNIGYASEYAEPGYTQPAKGIVFANWNVFPRGLDSILERAGYEIEWSDEWSTCEDCGRAVRTSADSYGWTRSYVIMGEGSLLCRECVDEDEYINEYLLNKTDAADTFGIDLAAHGFTKVNADSYQNGWHPGQNDNPRDIADKLTSGVDYVFQIDDKGQFDIRFSVWTRPVEDEDTDTED